MVDTAVPSVQLPVSTRAISPEPLLTVVAHATVAHACQRHGVFFWRKLSGAVATIATGSDASHSHGPDLLGMCRCSNVSHTHAHTATPYYTTCVRRKVCFPLARHINCRMPLSQPNGLDILPDHSVNEQTKQRHRTCTITCMISKASHTYTNMYIGYRDDAFEQ